MDAFHQWWLGEFDKNVGLPETYLAVDIETTGGSPARTLATQLGYAFVEGRVVVSSGAIVVDWTAHGCNNRQWYYTQLEKIAGVMAQKGQVYATPPVTMRKFGRPWDEAMDEYREILALAKDQGFHYIGHNIWNYDRPIVERLYLDHFSADKRFSFPKAKILDTGLVEKAININLAPPQSPFTLADWYDAACAKSSGSSKWNLSEHCSAKYHLDVDLALAHTAEYDCITNHRLVEAYRAIACDTNSTKTRPVSEAISPTT